MLTGTPLDLTPFGPLLSWLGVTYWLLALALAGFALWVPVRWWLKVLVALGILVAFGYPVLTHQRETKQQVDVAKARLDAATVHFEMRCKSAGEKITRTVSNVEGVLLVKVRPAARNGADPMLSGAAFYREFPGDEYITSFLWWEQRHQQGGSAESRKAAYVSSAISERPGYKFVEVIDSAGVRKRYRWAAKSTQQAADTSRHSLVSEEAGALPPRYAVDFEDIVDPVDRSHWVAGSTVRVIDTQTNEVMAQLVRFAFEPGLGSTAGFRDPWAFARLCPSPISSVHSSTRFFVDQVLIPSQGK